MHSTTPTPTYFAKMYGPNGNARRVAITLPYIASIAGDPHYAAPPQPEPLAIERARRWSEKLIRCTLGRDRNHTARLVNRIGYERVMLTDHARGA